MYDLIVKEIPEVLTRAKLGLVSREASERAASCGSRKLGWW